MKIKKLEAYGFKSFSEKMEIDFPAGVTAVVGPNGCGKSNVVDAIRWALGEQSPKQLRGKSMEDIIFNGSETKKPLGMAEVVLTFSNENGHSIPEYLDFSEIAVGRRLFRSGESEYTINKVPCRLKDITDLFLGTGIGHRAYSIVEQGKMDFVLNAKPEERRILIEEAAGITKYKDRKATALRKMEATQQNLLRLSDVIGEIKRQMNSLNRQAKKAERYKGYREETRVLELGQAAQTRRNFEAQRKEMEASLQEMQDAEVKAGTAMREVEAAVERTKVNLLDLERDLTVQQERLGENENAIQSREREIELSLQEKENLQKQIVRAEEEIGKLSQQKESAAQEIRNCEEIGSDIESKLARDRELLAGKETVLAEKKSSHAEAEAGLAIRKNEFVDLLTRQAHLKNSLVDLQRHCEEFSRRREKIARERGEGEQRVEEIQLLLDQQERQLAERRNARMETEKERAAKVNRKEELQVSLKTLQASLAQDQERLNRESSRLNSLLELQKNFEGYQEGVRAILLKRQAQGGLQNGICGLVEDIVETDPRYEVVVESVLGEKLQHIIVQNHEESLKAIEFLKGQGAGRSSFIPLQVKTHPAAQASSAPDEKATPLLELVRVKEDFASLAYFLFGDVWVVPDLRQAIELWNRDSIWKTLVTLDGEVLHPSGVVTGGSKEQIGSGTFHRKREIRDLIQGTEELRRQVVSREQEQERILSDLREFESSIEDLTQALHQEDLQIVGEAKELDQHKLELKRWGQTIETLQWEESQLADECLAVQQEARENEAALEELTRRKAEEEEELRRKEGELQQLKEEIEELFAAVTEVKVQVVALQEKKQNLEQNLERAQRLHQETDSYLRYRRDEKQDNLTRIGESEERKQKAEAEQSRLLAIHQDLQRQLEERKELLRAEREKLEHHERDWKECRDSQQRLQEEKSGLSMKRMELDLNLKHLLSTVEEKHRIPSSEFLAREIDRDYFAPEIEERLAELKSLMESMGEVNLLAIQEYEESRVRLEFLTEQEGDLIQSMASLDQAIKKINRTSRKRFAVTFAAVNEKFKEMFKILFNGGRAEMVLTDEANLLETGVEIIVQPPGKKLQNVNLLSGGEKALTAVALIFSLFFINPSPFCLMDEVDAPLDDANIGRFNRMIKELAMQYQIILVTHNKRTMEIADTLYGVTMEEPGISKLISVRLN